MNESCFEHLHRRTLERMVSLEAVVVRPGPGVSAGARLVLDAAGEVVAGTLPASLLGEIRRVARDWPSERRQQLIEIQETEVYLERWAPPPRLFLFGGGHVGRALCAVLSPLSLAVYVIEDREFFADPTRFQGNVRCLKMPLSEAAETLEIGPEDLVVIATRGHCEDLTCLKTVLPRGPRFLGMLGSRRKLREFHKLLVQEGFPPQSLEEVRCPVGLDIGAETPEEIAVAVAAELIGVLAGRPISC